MSVQRSRKPKKISRSRYASKKKRAQTNETGSKTRFKQGYYKPLNEEKYKQPLDSTMNDTIYPQYRSSWELALFKFLDKSDDVLEWASEPFPIYYISPRDGQKHRYFPDLWIKFRSGETWLVEIKPKGQTGDSVNLAKWEAAKKLCEESGMKFLVLTEKELKTLGLIS